MPDRHDRPHWSLNPVRSTGDISVMGRTVFSRTPPPLSPAPHYYTEAQFPPPEVGKYKLHERRCSLRSHTVRGWENHLCWILLLRESCHRRVHLPALPIRKVNPCLLESCLGSRSGNYRFCHNTNDSPIGLLHT